MKLKTYATTLSVLPGHPAASPRGQGHAIVATTSQKRAAELMGVTVAVFRFHGHESNNAEEKMIAEARPSTVFVTQLSGPRSWFTLDGSPL